MDYFAVVAVRRPLEERLLAKLEKGGAGECWEWLGARSLQQARRRVAA